MACFYTEECGACAVTPILVTPCIPSKCCEDPPVCYPCLPRCTKPKVMYCCESRPPKPRPVCCEPEYCDECPPPPPPRQRCPRPPPRQCPVEPNCCPTCCRPIKTKYVIPCYRYEDGRITNQPTVLMRRACEVAVGARERRKPFVQSSYSADERNVEHRYHSEDERGNCCIHYERKKCDMCASCLPTVPCPECKYNDCVYARVVNEPKSCCRYC